MNEMLRVAVCDDDAVANGVTVGAVSGILEKHGLQSELYAYRTAGELDAAMSRTAFDLILLDIDLPDLSGIEFCSRLRAEKNAVPVIFVSGHLDSVFSTFRCEPIGFVRKTRFLQDLSECIGIFLERRSDVGAGTKTLTVISNKRTLMLAIDSIVYIEGALKKQKIFVKGENKAVVASASMKSLEGELSPYGFIRIHSGFLVNYRFIKLIGASDVLLSDGKSLPISRGQSREVRERYMELVNGIG